MMDTELQKLYRAILMWGDEVECCPKSYAIGDITITVFNIYKRNKSRTPNNKVTTLVAPSHKEWYERVKAFGAAMDARWT